MMNLSRPSSGSSSSKRFSSRIEQNEATRVLDDASRNRRMKRQLDALEQDNAHEDPHANLVWHKAIPKFEDGEVAGPSGKTQKSKKDKSKDSSERKKRKFGTEIAKTRFRKNFLQMLEEENNTNKDNPKLFNAYMRAYTPTPKRPARHFCAVCGYFSNYKCIKCGARYCSIRCRDVHADTRCMKWTA
ncbi:hypothetical protein WR25_03343 [Diploscapter pachys]|uniref:HIT-type domain-containing protein n=1 Tax=Diploscapter pachys TaxID=2018661 RepID=A0A2A2L3S8_9BILA|nr:hypothetical protein WR25_03343 [Diploscapter pachys]